MTSFHELQNRRRDLLNDLDELEEAAAEIAAALATPISADEETMDQDTVEERCQHLAWLERQRAGLLVVLSETERSLLAFDSDNNDEP